MDPYHLDGPDVVPKLHRYPDPDYAAVVNQYPWVREGIFPPCSRRQPQQLEPWHGLAIDPSLVDDQNKISGWKNTGDCSKTQNSSRGERLFDPDFQVSDGVASEDDIISEISSDLIDAESPSSLEDNDLDDRFDKQTKTRARADGACPAVSRGKGRGGRPKGFGRGGRGIKRGIRKPVEPAPEFKALHSQATIAFIAKDYEEAELLTLDALKRNPEMYQAHNLLSQIHAARGDKDKALAAAWHGAHTRPRDTQVWARLARQILDHVSDSGGWSIQDAIQCFTRIINVDKTNFDARYQRAALNRELGHRRKAAAEYEHLRKQLPHDTTVLRHLAEVYLDLNEADRALCHYEATITHLQVTEPVTALTLTWSDVNIVAELYWYLRRFDEAITKIKFLARWLLGRGNEEYWTSFDLDDREWDSSDRPRRLETPGFVPDMHELASYGDGLPLELRVKLGLFRLHSPKHDLSEAIHHFKWLNPEDDQLGAILFEYPDLYREVGNALREQEHYNDALGYYEPLLKVAEYSDAPFLMELASCYRAIDLRLEAEDCYKTIIENDADNGQARLELVAMHRQHELAQRETMNSNELGSDAGQKQRRDLRTRTCRPKTAPSTSKPPRLAMLAPRPTRQITKQTAIEKEQAREVKIYDLFLRRQSFADELKGNNKAVEAAWTDASRVLLQDFQDNRVFYPFDKHHKFYGYTKEARSLASKPKYRLDSLIEKSASVIETADGEEMEIPTKYCGISFSEWLNIFLEYSLSNARHGDIKTAYETLSSAFNANVYHHSQDSLFSIQVCWFACALFSNDEETLCNTARWFMKEYQFVTDGYRLFSALNRLCDSENIWFNSGPSQKYILRQLKAVDFSFAGAICSKNMFQERAAYTTKGSNEDPVKATEMDVALLMLYGHVLYAGKSYAYAVNYFLRALALDPNNPTIKLSLALGYMHWALKRQAENRHHILIQGFAFLQQYYNAGQNSGVIARKQEAEYNSARTYHLLGLTHLAVPYYERCLTLGSAMLEEEGTEAEEFCREAAFALQSIWAAGGNFERAFHITEDWLCFGKEDHSDDFL